MESYFVELSREVAPCVVLAAGPVRVSGHPGNPHDQSGQETVQDVVMRVDGETLSPQAPRVHHPITALQTKGSTRRSIWQIKLRRLRLLKALRSNRLKVDHRLSIILRKLCHRLNQTIIYISSPALPCRPSQNITHQGSIITEDL